MGLEDDREKRWNAGGGLGREDAVEVGIEGWSGAFGLNEIEEELIQKEVQG